jgi:nucleoside-diphosphate-sugar epimerase
MSTYLITGIAGFIGSSLARAVLQRGDRVRGIDTFSTGKPENIAEIIEQIDFREADLLIWRRRSRPAVMWTMCCTRRDPIGEACSAHSHAG